MKSTLKLGFIALIIMTFLFPGMALADKDHNKASHGDEQYEEGSGSSSMDKGKATKAGHEKKAEGFDSKAEHADATHEDSGKHMGMEKGQDEKAKADHKQEGS